MSHPPPRLYVFGPFRLDAQRRLLMRGDAVVKLAPKVFETLLALVEGRARILEKAELMQHLWPNTFVEEGNLTLHISTLRKALGETLDQHRYIVTVPGRGYRFVADVTQVVPEPTERGLVEPVASAEAVESAVPAANDPPANTGAAAVEPAAASPPVYRRLRWMSIAATGLVSAAACAVWLSQSTD